MALLSLAIGSFGIGMTYAVKAVAELARRMETQEIPVQFKAPEKIR